MNPGIKRLSHVERRLQRRTRTRRVVTTARTIALLAAWAALAGILTVGCLGCGQWALPTEPDTMASDHPAVEHTSLATVKGE